MKASGWRGIENFDLHAAFSIHQDLRKPRRFNHKLGFPNEIDAETCKTLAEVSVQFTILNFQFRQPA